MKHPANQTLYTYWNRLRAGRSAPERGDIDPAAIRGVLADTFLVEIDDRGGEQPAGITVRLAGTRVNTLFDRDTKGQSLWTWWCSGDLPTFQAVVNAVLHDACPAVIGAVGSPDGYPDLQLELLLLPLRHRGKTHARMLGALAPAAIPTWLGLMPVGPLSLTSHRMVEDRPEASRPQPLRLHAPANTRRIAPTRRGHFTIYEGGRGLSVEESEMGLRPN